MRFALKPWRRRFWAEDGLVVPVLGITAVLAVGLVALHDLFDVELFPALLLAVGGVGVAVGLAWALGHRRIGAGEITFADGRIIVEQRRGWRIDAPVAAIRQAFVQRHPGRPEDDLLFLQIEGHRWVRIRLVRLEGPPEALERELHAQIAVHGDLDAFARASSRTVEQHQWALAVVLGIAVVLTAWTLLT